jgi:hypothetical protein
MARKDSQKVDVAVKGRGTVTLTVKAEDEHTIYLEGKWTFVGAKLDDKKAGKDEVEKFTEEVLGRARRGTFERKNGSKDLRLDGASVVLTGVDSMHGLAYGGKGKAACGKLGSQDWMAY